MIPKNLFMCKVGKELTPQEEVHLHFARKHNSDFKVRLLTEANWASLTNPSTFEVKAVRLILDFGKYAKASDVIRWIALRDLGGIAIDMDVVCLKSFNRLIARDFVSTDGTSCNAVVGAEENSEFAKQMVVALMADLGKKTDDVLEDVVKERAGIAKIRNEITLARKHTRVGLNLSPSTLSIHLCKGEDLPWATQVAYHVEDL